MDKDLLFKPRLEEQELDLDGVGTVRIRALSRDEVATAREDNTDRKGTFDHAGYEYQLLAVSMIDPELTVDEVERWARAAPAGELTTVVEAIQRLSKLDEESSKSGVPANRQERRAAVRNGSRRKPR